MSDPKEMVKIAVAALEDKKGEDVKIIDIHEISVLADYFIIADGNNGNQVQSANWILMDYGDIIIHIFCREDRLFYDLERIWRDGKTIVDVKEL